MAIIARVKMFRTKDTNKTNPTAFHGQVITENREEYNLLLWEQKALSGEVYFTGILITPQTEEKE